MNISCGDDVLAATIEGFQKSRKGISASQIPIKRKISMLSKVADREAMYGWLKACYPKGIIAELGVAGGVNLQGMVGASDPQLAIAIDVFQDDGNLTVTDGMTNNSHYQHFEQAVYSWANYRNEIVTDSEVVIIKGYTYEAVSLFPDGFFDFVYIDADHSKEAVLRDMQQWWPKVAVGGTLAGHNYFQHQSTYQFGVVEAVAEFRQSISNENFFYSTPEVFAPSWFIVKSK